MNKLPLFIHINSSSGRYIRSKFCEKYNDNFIVHHINPRLYLDRVNRGYIEMVDANPAATDLDVFRNQTKKLATVAGGAGGLEAGLGAEEKVGGGFTQQIEVTPLSTDVTSANDYTKNYGTQYAQLGYQGPQTIQGFSEAGFYGGDPFSFAQVLRANTVGVPQSTIKMT